MNQINPNQPSLQTIILKQLEIIYETQAKFQYQLGVSHPDLNQTSNILESLTKSLPYLKDLAELITSDSVIDFKELIAFRDAINRQLARLNLIHDASNDQYGFICEVLENGSIIIRLQDCTIDVTDPCNTLGFLAGLTPVNWDKHDQNSTIFESLFDHFRILNRKYM